MSDDRLQTSIILSPTNDVVRHLNAQVLKMMPGNAANRVFLSKTKLDFEQNTPEDFIVPQDELNGLAPSNIPPHVLTVRLNAIVMLLINLDRTQGHCNGTRYVVTGIFDHALRLKQISPFNGIRREIFLPKMWMRSDDIPVAGTVSRYQFPVSLAFAVTINKSQGQGFDHVGIYLKKPVFSHGQFYVAVSRGKKRENVSIVIIKGPKQGPIGHLRGGRYSSDNVVTQNIVIRCLL